MATTDQTDIKPAYLRPAQAAKYLSISAQHLQRMRSQGIGPRFRKGSNNIVLYAVVELDRWALGQGKYAAQKKGGLKQDA